MIFCLIFFFSAKLTGSVCFLEWVVHAQPPGCSDPRPQTAVADGDWKPFRMSFVALLALIDSCSAPVQLGPGWSQVSVCVSCLLPKLVTVCASRPRPPAPGIAGPCHLGSPTPSGRNCLVFPNPFLWGQVCVRAEGSEGVARRPQGLEVLRQKRGREGMRKREHGKRGRGRAGRRGRGSAWGDQRLPAHGAGVPFFVSFPGIPMSRLCADGALQPGS